MTRIAIILGSTRPGRNGEAVAHWAHAHAAKRADATYELVDLAEQNLPLLDEPVPPSMGKYTKPHTKNWAAKIATYDGFVFVTAEYNHGIPGALKNAIDFIYGEWNNKAAAFVSYGSAGGTRAVEQLRLVMRCSPTSRTSPSSPRARSTLSRWTRCSTSSSPGATRSHRCERADPIRQ